MNRSEVSDPPLQETVQAKLLSMRTEWERRLAKIEADRRRRSAPLEADFEEQAVQRENDDALDALDTRGRQELLAIEAALRRLGSQQFGECVRCGAAIAEERLLAQPTASTCLSCARGGAAG